jgi:hypothetical protein
MTAEKPFQLLIQSLDVELALLRQLRDLTEEAHGPLSRLEIDVVEVWVQCQKELLSRISDASELRADLQESCLPVGARGIAGTGGLANTVTLHALIGRAPRAIAARLRQQRDSLRQLRDEISVMASRNEALIAQVLVFTDHLGHSLAETGDSSYNAAGGLSDRGQRLSSGELFTSAL